MERNVTGGAFFGDEGSLYADDVTIMLSPSNFVVVLTESFSPAMTIFPVESLVLMTVKVVVESDPSRLPVPFQTPRTSAAVSAAGAAGGGGAAAAVSTAGVSALEHATTATARSSTLRI